MFRAISLVKLQVKSRIVVFALCNFESRHVSRWLVCRDLRDNLGRFQQVRAVHSKSTSAHVKSRATPTQTEGCGAKNSPCCCAGLGPGFRAVIKILVFAFLVQARLSCNPSRFPKGSMVQLQSKLPQVDTPGQPKECLEVSTAYKNESCKRSSAA